MIDWQYYPKSRAIPEHLKDTVEVFKRHGDEFDSAKHKLESDAVLAILRDDLEHIGYKIERGKTLRDKIRIPVLFGMNGTLEKSFDADGYNEQKSTVLEVEAGRGFTNYQFLKDLFQACMMHNVVYLVIAVRKLYIKNRDFDKVVAFFDTLFASGRLQLPLEGILIIGY